MPVIILSPGKNRSKQDWLKKYLEKHANIQQIQMYFSEKHQILIPEDTIRKSRFIPGITGYSPLTIAAVQHNDATIVLYFCQNNPSQDMHFFSGKVIPHIHMDVPSMGISNEYVMFAKTREDYIPFITNILTTAYSGVLDEMSAFKFLYCTVPGNTNRKVVAIQYGTATMLIYSVEDEMLNIVQYVVRIQLF